MAGNEHSVDEQAAAVVIHRVLAKWLTIDLIHDELTGRSPEWWDGIARHMAYDVGVALGRANIDLVRRGDHPTKWDRRVAWGSGPVHMANMDSGGHLATVCGRATGGVQVTHLNATAASCSDCIEIWAAWQEGR